MMLLLLIFSAAILLLLLTGAKSYKALVTRGRTTQDERICELYLSNRLHQAASPESMRLARYDGIDCLEIVSKIDGKEYLTRVYCADGWIRELFSDAELTFRADAGERVAEAQGLSFEEKDGLLLVKLRFDGYSRQMTFAWKEAVE